MGLEQQLAITGNSFRGQPLPWLFEMMTDVLGIHVLDCNYSNIDSVGITQFARLLDKYGITPAVISVSPALGRIGSVSGREQARASLLRAIHDAQVVGAPAIQFHTDVPDATTPADRQCGILEDLKPVLDEAAEAGVCVLLENNFDSRSEDPRGVNPARSPFTLAGLFEAASSGNFGFTFDPCNFYLAGVDPYPTAYAIMRPYIHGVHLKNCEPLQKGVYQDKEPKVTLTDSQTGPHVPTPLKQGSVPWAAILQALENSSYEGYLILEPLAPDGDLVTWCREACSYLREGTWHQRSIAGQGRHIA